MTRYRNVAVSLLAVALLASVAVGGGSFLQLAAPASGDAWAAAYGANGGSLGDQADRGVTGATTVASPYGDATVRLDADGVPHITAENEQALAFAVGYVQARDRLFQMDLQRRLMRGQLAEAFGERAVESDRFHRQMDFASAAEASWAAVEDTETGDGVRAYTAGVNRYMATNALPTEFRLNGYEPREWTPTDTLLVGKLIAWQLTGDFRDLQMASVEEAFGNVSDVYPRYLAHDASIVGRSQGGTVAPNGSRADRERVGRVGDYAALYDDLSQYQREPGIGSNSWVVSGEHTDDGEPIVANDPHLSLTVPPVWYEMHLQTEGMNVRGVAFPGLPVVVIGHNEDVAWGFTNVGADQTDLYTYEMPSEDTYVYEGETREVQTRTETIEVSGAENVNIEVRKTVHGPLIERDGQQVAVSWLGLTGTREARAIYAINDAESLDDVEEALRMFDTPTQNIVAADSQGNTMYRITGKYPYRFTNGEQVAGDLPFDGSAGEGEWRGFEPYGQTDWEAGGFVPFEQVPHVDNPDVLGTANQRVTANPGFYLAYSERYADPYRGARIYGRLEARVESGEPVTERFMQRLQRDVRSRAAVGFKPAILDATDEMAPAARAEANELADWNGGMRRDSRSALLWALFREEVRNETFYDEFHPQGLDESAYPHLYALQRLPADSRWFDDIRTSETETRADVYADAFERAVNRADREGYETYGDYNRVDLDHPFPVDYLDYPELPTDGSPFTVSNFRVGGPAGSSWRMVVGDDAAYGIIPGGQSGNPYSPHYSDQLRPWANGEYREVPLEESGPVVIRFRGEN
ncbi:penicillin acylase family protein [Halorarius litoreus]|uniref:penicillin acylase family protein n=1 Tax=Halorarius litoreus TaxID=2962676 RepID=UPI0020CBDDC9|nr:penicillin acylase family protein [Halorarius litoreus]